MKKIVIIVFVFASYFAQAQSDVNKVDVKSSSGKKSVEVFLLANIGGGILTGTEKVNGQAEKDLVNSLRNGLVFDVGLYFKLNNGNAIGLKFNRFASNGNFAVNSTNNSGDNITVYGDVKIGINFYSASYLLNFNKTNSPHDFILDLSAGYLSYDNNVIYSATINGQKATLPNDYTYGFIQGNTFGFLAGFAYKYRASDKFSFGPNISFMTGVISKVEQKLPESPLETVYLSNDDAISLSRFDFSVGATYKF